MTTNRVPKPRGEPGMIGARLKAARIAKDWSLTEVLIRTGIYTNSLSKLENDLKDAHGATIKALAKEYECSTDYLFGLSPWKDGGAARIAELEARIRELEGKPAKKKRAGKKRT